jgi:hypothetical protein
MSVATANTAGHTKKITVNATVLIGYCLGNFIGPFFFKTGQAPVYPLGVGMMFFCIAVQVLSLVALWVLLWMRNRERRGICEREGVGEVRRLRLAYDKGMQDETDLQNEFFQVSPSESVLLLWLLTRLSMCIEVGYWRTS